MNKRKMTSIALATAVAISTVQLAYPANVFAHEQVNETRIENVREVENNTNEVSRNSKTFEVENENDLKNAIENANGTEDNPTVITVTKSFEITGKIKVAENKHIVLQGINNQTFIKFANNIQLPTTQAELLNHGIFAFGGSKNNTDVTNGNSSMVIKNIILDGNNQSRIIRLGYGNKLQIEEGAILQNGSLKNGVEEGTEPSNSKLDATNSGAAVYMQDNSSIKMNGGIISNNYAARYGAGFYGFANNVKIDISKGVFNNNTSNRYGAAISLPGNPGSEVYLNNVTFENNTTEKDSDFNSTHSSDVFVGTGVKIGISGEARFINNDNQHTINMNGNDKKIYLIGKFLGDINLKDTNLDKKYGTVYLYGTDNYKITEEDAKNLSKDYFDENEMLNVEENNLVLREAVKVTFNSNTGENPEEKTQKVAKKNEAENTLKTALLKNTFSKEGYTFLGWATEANGDVIYKDGDSISTDEEVTLYAKWIENSKTITYNPDVETSLGLGSSGITAKVKEGKDVISISEGKIKTIGVGDAIIEYSVGEIVIAEHKITVEPRENDVAIVNKIPYDNFDDVIKNLDSNQDITIINNELNKNGIKLSETLEIKDKKNIIIDFNGVKLSSSKENINSLIKITNSTGIIIKDANFDLSNGGEVAILVDGTNNASNVTLVGAINATRGTKKAPVVKMVGDKSEVNIEEGAKLNDDLIPSIGKEDDASIILGKDSLASNIHNKNNSSGGGNYYPSKPSKPTYTHEKIKGLDRYETAGKIADKLGSYDTAVLVNATSTMSDGLAASGLAGKENGAILLTKKDSIPKATMDRIKKVKKVYIIGGENAISQKVANQITAANIKVERLGGKTRVETSELVAKEIGNYSSAFIVNGFKGEADAMSASAVAAKNEAPILLTNGKTSTHAKKAGVEYYVVGGTSVFNKSIADKYNAERLAGSDRYATNREVINEFYSGSDKLYIANGDKLVDALTASPLAKNHGIVLVNEKSDKSILKDKNTVQVGGMDFEIEFE